MFAFDRKVEAFCSEELRKLEDYFQSDVLFYNGDFSPSYLNIFREFVEGLFDEPTEGQAAKPHSERTLTIILRTGGGVVQAVEKMVEIIRHHYSNLYFVVPEHAMSAGTVFCMAGNRIYMDYASSLGPIDPQLDMGDGRLIPAMGYLDPINRILKKSEEGKSLSMAEIILLREADLAELNQYEQARDLSITLLENWLATYKFADWDTHATDPDKLGHPVTVEEKKERAKEIGKLLSNHNHWHSHGRYIGLNTVRNDLRLKIEDYTDNKQLRELIRSYHDVIVEYAGRIPFPLFIHTRKTFNNLLS